MTNGSGARPGLTLGAVALVPFMVSLDLSTPLGLAALGAAAHHRTGRPPSLLQRTDDRELFPARD